eukprot:723184-Amphidinium_carterae.1
MRHERSQFAKKRAALETEIKDLESVVKRQRTSEGSEGDENPQEAAALPKAMTTAAPLRAIGKPRMMTRSRAKEVGL